MRICSICQGCYEDAVARCVTDNGSLGAARADLSGLNADYQLEFLLESDAASETYRMRRTGGDQPLTIKIVFADMPGASVAQWQQMGHEAQAAAEVQHPNVARIYESGALANGDFYVVSELIAGLTLRERLENADVFSEVEAAAVARQTAEALAAAHSVGVIHRAVNPSNIVFVKSELYGSAVKLQNFDFGAVAQQSAAAELELPSLTGGRSRYLSPEQFTGAEVDARSDIYSLGAVFYEMLGGRAPFDALVPAASGEREFDEQQLLRVRYDVRALVTYVLKQSLKTGAATRLSSAANFARQLRQIESLVAPPPAMRPNTAPSPETPVAQMPLKKSVHEPVVEESTAAVVLPPTVAASDSFSGGERENVGIEPLTSNPISVKSRAATSSETESEPILIKKREVGSDQFKAAPILIKRKQPVPEPSQPTTVAPVVFDEAAFVAEEKKTVTETVFPPVFQTPTAVKKPKAQSPLLAFDDSYVPPRTPKFRRLRQRSLFVGAALLALLTAVGIGAFLYGQQATPFNVERASQPTSNADVSPPMPSNSAVEVPPASEPLPTDKPITTAPLDDLALAEQPAEQPSAVTTAKRELPDAPLPPDETTDAPMPPKPVSEKSLTAAPPVETAPTAAVKPEIDAADGDDRTQLNSSLGRWISATNERDVEQQMNYYAPRVDAYYRARNASPELVRAEKKRVFERADAIDIQTGEPEIKVSRDGQRATMRFRKKYAIREGEKNRRGEVMQELQWVKTDGDWKIVSERDVKVINR